MPHEASNESAGGCQLRVLVFAASLRSGSLNQRLADLAAAVIEEHGAVADRAAMADFDCPSYNGDVEKEAGVPAGAQRFRDRLVAADAFVIASPEYNASMPGCLKTAIDWVSRIRPQPFNGRQGMLLSAPPSMAGGHRRRSTGHRERGGGRARPPGRAAYRHPDHTGTGLDDPQGEGGRRVAPAARRSAAANTVCRQSAGGPPRWRVVVGK